MGRMDPHRRARSGLAELRYSCTAFSKPGLMSMAQIAIVVLLSVGTSSFAAELAELDEDTDLADPTLAEDLALQTEMMNYFCGRNGDSAICHKLDHDRELHGGEGGHWQLPVQHLQEEEDEEVHSVWCAEGAPGATGNPRLCDEYEKRTAARLRDRVLKEQEDQMATWWCAQPVDRSHHTVSDRSELLPCIKHRKLNNPDPGERKILHALFQEYRARFKGKPQASARYWREKMALAWCNADHHDVTDTVLCNHHDNGQKYHRSEWKDEL